MSDKDTPLLSLEQVRRRILQVCHDKGISVEELSRLSGVHANTLYGIRSGRHKSPRYVTVVKILETLDLLE